jgi:putative ABC transport system permease protein
MSYSVNQRLHEIGVRMALGAQYRDILMEFIGRGSRLVLMGITLGLVGALAASRFLASSLFGVEHTDLATYVFDSFLILLCALGALYVPLHRAMRIDPLLALRHE